MKMTDFQKWIDEYGLAWINGDPAAVVNLFSADAAYYETPLDPPMTGRNAIFKYWKEGAQEGQTGVNFHATIIAIDGDTGYARWQASFTRVPANTFVELDGVLAATFDSNGQCSEFREWWHRRESQPQ